MIELFNNYTFQIVALGATLLGIVCGIVGVFAVLKKESLIGDAVSHAALPGICVAYLIVEGKDLIYLLIGALASGLIAITLINYILKYNKIKYDNVLALILSTFFGLGIVLITYIQILPGANKAGLNKFIFGQAAAILKEDIYIIIFVALIVLSLLLIFWHKFKLIVFDYTFANTVYGKKVYYYNLLLSFMIVVCVVIGLEMVGVILMSSLLVVPAVAARQWSNNLGFIVLLAALIGGSSGFLGTLISASELNLPTGPVIILILSIIVLFSLIFSNKRGLLKKYLYRRRKQKEIVGEINKLRGENSDVR